MTEEEKNYNGVEFRRNFDIQQRNRGVLFAPSRNYLTMAPLDHLVFSMWVRVSLKPPDDNKVIIQLKSETTWGRKTQELRIIFDTPKS